MDAARGPSAPPLIVTSDLDPHSAPFLGRIGLRVLSAMAAGSITGPLVLGPVAAAAGLRFVFVLVAALAVVGLALRPPVEPADQPLVSTTLKRASPDIIRS